VRIAIVCDAQDRESARALVAALEKRGAAASVLDPGAPEQSGPTAELAHNLVEVESQLAASPADAVALIGSGEAPFAGVLVATKERLPAFWLKGSASNGGEIDNGALIERLADHAVDADAPAAAEAIERTLSAS
jgi:hypothetical protein